MAFCFDDYRRGFLFGGSSLDVQGEFLAVIESINFPKGIFPIVEIDLVSIGQEDIRELSVFLL